MNVFKLKNIPALLFMLMFSIAFVSCESDDVDDDVVADKDRTIANFVQNDEDFSTLKEALDRTNLSSVLDDEDGDFTLFAPNNSAFAKIDVASMSDEDLKNVLLYHVIKDNRVRGGDLLFKDRYFETESAAGPNGEKLSIMLDREDDVLSVNDIISVSSTENDFKNGVIYELNDVLALPTLVSIVSNDKNLGNLESALGTATGDLITTLSGTDLFTIFAPNDDAFDDDEETLSTLTADQLSKILTYHVIVGNVVSDDLTSDMVVTTVNGETIKINILAGVIRVEDQGGEKTLINIRNIQTTNGVVHIIDDLLMPSDV